VVYAKPGSGIESPLDLQGKRIAVLAGASNYVGPLGIKSVLANFEVRAEYIEAASYDEAFAMVRDGRADAVVTNKYYGAAHAGLDLQATPMLLAPGKSKFGLPKNASRNAVLIEEIDSSMRSMKMHSGSTYYAASNKFLGGTTYVEVFEIVPPWMFWAVGILLVLVVSGAVAIYMLRESEQLYRSLVDNSPIPMMTLDLKGRIGGANRAMLARTGYKLSELKGMHLSELVGKESADVADAEFKRNVAGVPGRDIQIMIKAKSGLQKWFMARGQHISKKGAAAVLVVFTDVTGKKGAKN